MGCLKLKYLENPGPLKVVYSAIEAEQKPAQRFWSIDPLAAKYAYNSPYAYSENRLIDGVELEGLEWKLTKGRQKQPVRRVEEANDATYAGYETNEQGNLVPKPGTFNNFSISHGEYTVHYSSSVANVPLAMGGGQIANATVTFSQSFGLTHHLDSWRTVNLTAVGGGSSGGGKWSLTYEAAQSYSANMGQAGYGSFSATFQGELSYAGIMAALNTMDGIFMIAYAEGKAFNTTSEAIQTTDNPIEYFIGAGIVKAGMSFLRKDAAKGVVQAEKVSGSYLLEFQSGKFYAGKGLEPRMMQSINRIETTYGDKLLKSTFYPAPSTRAAFINEHNLMMQFGGPKSFNPLSPTYNKIFSPGRKLGGF